MSARDFTVVLDEDAVAREQRLRELHGVLELAVMLAGDALEEAHPDVSSRQWFEVLLSEASKQLEKQGRFRGRWSLFTAQELTDLTGGMPDELAVEIKIEREGRGLVGDEAPDAVRDDG